MTHKRLAAQLDELGRRCLIRRRMALEGPQGVRVSVEGRA